MTRDEFKQRAHDLAQRRGWTLDIVEAGRDIAAWFSEPHPMDAPGHPHGADTAQAYMKNGEEPVGLNPEPERDWAPETRHAPDCLYVTNDSPAPCTCGLADKVGERP